MEKSISAERNQSNTFKVANSADVENHNGFIVVQELLHANEPMTATDMITALSKRFDLPKRIMKISTKETLNAGVKYGFIRLYRRRYWVPRISEMKKNKKDNRRKEQQQQNSQNGSSNDSKQSIQCSEMSMMSGESLEPSTSGISILSQCQKSAQNSNDKKFAHAWRERLKKKSEKREIRNSARERIDMQRKKYKRKSSSKALKKNARPRPTKTEITICSDADMEMN